jgi:phosphatidylglycerol:prolipoprotein diacylglycerol transferase
MVVPLIALILSISIGMDPKLADIGPFELTWHGIFTAVGIAAGVYLGAWIGRRQGFTEDDAYSIALVGVPAGIIGARAMYVLENRVKFEGQWLDVFRINEGGITIYGAIIGGVLAAAAYGAFRRMPVMRGLDAAAFGLLLGMAIGRIGDLINGEHIAKVSSLPWAVKYTHVDSPGFPYSATPSGDFIARHPATTYEMIGDLLIIGIVAFLFIRFWRNRPGIVFFTGVVLYSAMRFGVSYLRIDSCPTGVTCPDYVISNWMTFPQVVSMCTFAIGIAGLIWSIIRSPQPEPAEPQVQPAATQRPAMGTRRA